MKSTYRMASVSAVAALAAFLLVTVPGAGQLNQQDKALRAKQNANELREQRHGPGTL